jgi:hypothetical protein
MAVTADKPVPYAPASAILEVVDRFRNRGLQSPISAEVLGRIGVSESLIPRTLQALRTLDLIDDEGKPTATLDGLRLAPEAEFKKHLAAWLKSAYAPVFSFVDPAVDGETRIRDAFRGYNPAAQQPRMITLFIGLCAAAGLIAEKAIPTPRNHAPRSAAAAPRPASRTPTTSARNAAPAQPSKRTTASLNAYGLPPAIAGLVESLPSPEQGWTAAERDKFLATFKAVLDYSIPVVTRKAPQADEAA